MLMGEQQTHGVGGGGGGGVGVGVWAVEQNLCRTL